MFFPIPDPVRRQAKAAHELAMINLLLFNLDMMFIALQRVAIAPMLMALMVLIMLASGALYQAQRGEVPERVLRRFPPPPDLTGADAEFASGTPSA